MKIVRCAFIGFLVSLLLIPACSSPRTGGEIKDNGKEIELTSKEHSVKAFKLDPIEDTFVVFTANHVSFPESMNYMDGDIIVLTKKDADQIKGKFGNFVLDKNKGHQTAGKLSRRYCLIGVDGKAQKKIKRLIKLNSRRLYPVVKITMSEIMVKELIYKNSKVFLSGSLAKQNLVTKIEILEENYPL